MQDDKPHTAPDRDAARPDPPRPAHRPGQPGSVSDAVDKPDTQNPGPRHSDGHQPIRESP